MLKSLFVLCSSVCLLTAGCQQAPKGDNQPQAASGAAAPATSISQTEARAAVGTYLQTQPNAGLYVLDSAVVNDNDSSWQVLVPRTDWAQRMPNRARFEVSKATGAVRTAAVK